MRYRLSAWLRTDREERGSVLFLFPAAVLVMIVLAAIAVDLTVAFMAQRELVNAAGAAANDAAAVALSDSSFYRLGRLELDPATVERVATERLSLTLDQDRHRNLRMEALAIPPSGAGCSWTVRVSASSSVGRLFAGALPGAAGSVRIKAVSTARPHDGGDLSGC